MNFWSLVDEFEKADRQLTDDELRFILSSYRDKGWTLSPKFAQAYEDMLNRDADPGWYWKVTLTRQGYRVQIGRSVAQRRTDPTR